MPDYITDLNDDVFFHIFSFIDIFKLQPILLTCKYLNRICTEYARTIKKMELTRKEFLHAGPIFKIPIPKIITIEVPYYFCFDNLFLNLTEINFRYCDIKYNPYISLTTLNKITICNSSINSDFVTSLIENNKGLKTFNIITSDKIYKKYITKLKNLTSLEMHCLFFDDSYEIDYNESLTNLKMSLIFLNCAKQLEKILKLLKLQNLYLNLYEISNLDIVQKIFEMNSPFINLTLSASIRNINGNLYMRSKTLKTLDFTLFRRSFLSITEKISIYISSEATLLENVFLFGPFVLYGTLQNLKHVCIKNHNLSLENIKTISDECPMLKIFHVDGHQVSLMWMCIYNLFYNHKCEIDIKVFYRWYSINIIICNNKGKNKILKNSFYICTCHQEWYTLL